MTEPSAARPVPGPPRSGPAPGDGRPAGSPAADGPADGEPRRFVEPADEPDPRSRTASFGDLERRPVAEHVAVYEAEHERLQRELGTIDQL